VSSQSPERIRAYLSKLLESRTFAGAERLRRLLTFLVEKSVSSPDEPLKEIVIGTELYAPDGDFDPRLSAAVRVDATRLRTKLREYYDSEGAADAIVIELPKGSYAPVFRDSSPPSIGEAPRGESKAEPSIAVLPFSNLSPTPDDFFSDGLTEEIIHALSLIPGIRVLARTSSFALKDRNADVREIGLALNVQLLLEGSVRKSGDTLRVTVQLVSTGDGYQLWSQRYDRQIHDVLTVQDEIAREVARMLQLSAVDRLSDSQAGRPTDYEAYAWYLRGRYHLNRQTGSSFRRAITCFEQAIERSPGYASAHSGLAVAWLYLGMFAMARPLDIMPKAREAASRALALNEREGEALSVAACVKAMFDWDWYGAEVLFREALALKSGAHLSAQLSTMFSLLPMGRIDESLAMLDTASRVDPLSLFLAASRGAVLLLARRPSEAEREYRRALELDPDFWRALLGLGRCYEMQGLHKDAISCFERAKAVSDGVPSSIGALGRAYALAGRRRDAEALLSELEETAKHRYVSPYGAALIYLGLGDERVFECLERTSEDRAAWLMYLATEPRFDPLRNDERFRSLLRRLNLPLIDYPASPQ
jgi:TolB-like protein/Flp pilus assembly protein TadD